MSERTIQTAILKWLNQQPGCLARNRYTGPFDTTGDPDITGCWNGHHFEIEVKLPGERPSAIQSKRIKEWRNAGATVFVATALCDAQRELKSKENEHDS